MQLTNYVQESRKFCAKRRVFDDDLVQEIAITMWQADNDFDGRGEKIGYRANRSMYKLLSLFRERKEDLDRRKIIEKHYRDTQKIDYYSDIFSKCRILLSRLEYDILHSYFVENLNFKEMGQKYGTTRETIRTRLKRIISKLKSSHCVY